MLIIIQYAAITCSIDLCRFLIQSNADVYLRDENGRYMLNFVVKYLPLFLILVQEAYRQCMGCCSL